MKVIRLYELRTCAFRVEHAASLFADHVDLETGKQPVRRDSEGTRVVYAFLCVSPRLCALALGISSLFLACSD